MRTLVLVPELDRSAGGIARSLRLYIRALAEEAQAAAGAPGARTDVVVLNDRPGDAPRPGRARAGDPETPGRLVLHPCARSKPAFLWRALRLGWTAERVVCGHVHLLPVCWLLRGLRPRLRYFLVAHGIEVWRDFSWAERGALRRASRIICVSDHTCREVWRRAPGLDAARLVVIPNALDLAIWGKPAQRPEGTDGTGPHGPDGAPSGPEAKAVPRILTVARLTSADREKGVETVIRAMPAIRTAWPRAQLRIVGSGDDEVRLRDLAAALGLSAAAGSEPDSTAAAAGGGAGAAPVVFRGALDDEALWVEYAACDLFALPSRKEGFGMVFLEAMAFGKPCIAADAGGAPEVIASPDDRSRNAARGGAQPPVADGVEDSVQGEFGPAPDPGRFRATAGGALVPYGDVAAVAAAVQELIAHPRESAAIRARAQEFGYESFKARVLGVLARH